MLVTSTLIAAVCAKLNTAGNLTVAAATTHVMVDDPDVSIVDRRALPQDVATLQKRAELYGRLMVTTPVLEAIGKRAGLPPDQIAGVDRTTADVPIPLTEPASEERASQIRASQAPYRLELQSHPDEPVLAIYAVAPSWPEAQRLADSAVPGLQDYLRDIARLQGFPEEQLPQLRQLGSARGGTTNGKAKIVIAGLTFFTAFGLSFVLLLLLLRRFRRPRTEDAPVPAPRARLSARAAADWPRTDARVALVGRRPHHDVLAHPVRQDRAGDPGADRPHARPARPARRRRRLADRLHRRPRCRAAAAPHARASRDLRVPRVRVRQRGARRPLPQPDRRAHAGLEEAPAARLLHLGLRDRGELRAAHRGSRVPDVHPRPLGARRASGSSTSPAS